MLNEISIRDAKDQDRLKILNLLNSVFSENQRSSFKRGEDFWQWKFKSKIFGNSILTIAESNEEIIGIDHLWPWELKCRGTVIKAYQPCDSALASSYRGKGIFKQLRIRGIEEAMARKHQLLFNFPNENSLPVNLSIGAQHLGKITWWVKILAPMGMVMGTFGSELATSAAIDRKYTLNVDKLDHMSEVYHNFDQFISINRKAGFHEWRYQNRPNREYGMIIHEEKSKMIGGIFTLNQRGKSREMVIVDMLGDPKLSSHLFKKIIEAAKFLDASFLAVMDNQKFETRQLWKRGFIKKSMKNLVALPIDLSIEYKATNMENWSLVAGMHDSI